MTNSQRSRPGQAENIILEALIKLNEEGEYEHFKLFNLVVDEGYKDYRNDKIKESTFYDNLKKMKMERKIFHVSIGNDSFYSCLKYKEKCLEYICSMVCSNIKQIKSDENMLEPISLKSETIPNRRPLTKIDIIWLQNKTDDIKRHKSDVDLLNLDLKDLIEYCKEVSDWYIHDPIRERLNTSLKETNKEPILESIFHMIRMGFRDSHENQDKEQWTRWYKTFIEKLIIIVKDVKKGVENRKLVFHIFYQEIIMTSDNQMPDEVFNFIKWCFENFSKEQMELFEFDNVVRFIPQKDLVKIKSDIKKIVSNTRPEDEKEGVYLKKMLSKDPFLGL